MEEDFKVDKKVLEKFKEVKNKPKEEKKVQEVKEDEPIEEKVIPPKKTKNPKKVVKKKPVKNKPNKKKKKKTLKQVFQYPPEYKEELKALDKESEKFWYKYQPILFEGEKMILDISYGGVSTGKITINTLSSTKLGEEDVFHINTRIKTADFYSYLYELDDYCDSYLTKKDFRPLKFSLIQRESSQDIDDLQLFDLNELKTYSFYKRVTSEKEKKSKKVKTIPRYFQDPFSVIYFLRGLPMDIGNSYVIPLVNQGKVEILSAKVERKEVLSTKIGEREAYVLKIFTKAKGKTIKGGEMTFWFSTDEKRIFLKFKAKIKLGSINGEILEYKN